MRHLRHLLLLLIAVSLVAAPIASAWAAARASTAMVATGADVAAMADCQKSGMASMAGDCECCDSKSKCPDAAACLKKCSSQVVGYLMAGCRTIFVSIDANMRAEAAEPPDWMSAPPAPPPRA